MKNILNKVYNDVSKELGVRPSTVERIFANYCKTIKTKIEECDGKKYFCVSLPYIGKIKNFVKYENKGNQRD